MTFESSKSINEQQLQNFRDNEGIQIAPYKNRYRARSFYHDNTKHESSLDTNSYSKSTTLPLTAFLKTFESLPLDTPNFQAPKPNATWLGHATYLIQFSDLNLITDPVFSKRCSPSQLVGPKRYTPMPIDKRDLPDIDVVLISHNHYDHLDKASILYLHKRYQPLFVLPAGVRAWFERLGITHNLELSWWQEAEVRGHRIFCLPAQHFSGRGVKKNTTLWCSWMLEHPESRMYFAGDTGYSKDFKDINKVFPNVDIALLPIGAYAPESFFGPVHCSPEEAVQMHIDLQAKHSLAMHWGTFILTLEPIEEPPKRIAAAMKNRGLAQDAFQVLRHGQTISL